MPRSVERSSGTNRGRRNSRTNIERNWPEGRPPVSRVTIELSREEVAPFATMLDFVVKRHPDEAIVNLARDLHAEVSPAVEDALKKV